MTTNPPSIDVAVVGAGAAGVGVGVALSKLDVEFRVLDRESIGASFRQWPDEMRFITPSFPSNGFDLPDLNAVTPNTSPALTLDREHPSGDEFAEYLASVAEFHELPVETGVEVTDVVSDASSSVGLSEPSMADGGSSGFTLRTSDGPIHSQFVVWAAGEFGSPRRTPFPGAEHCVHNADVDAWTTRIKRMADDEIVIVGGYESGIDAAVTLADLGRSVTVLDPGAPWAFRSPDPSHSLAPYTIERMEEAMESGRITFVPGARVERVDRADDQFVLHVRSEELGVPPDDIPGIPVEPRYETAATPILATGFDSVLGPAADEFGYENGTPRLTDRDESTETPGLFLSGPAVSHDGVDFCFINEFRTRFPVVAETIGDRLGVETESMATEYRDSNMYVEDPTCCEPEICDC